MPCHSCGEMFNSKAELMIHRKLQHSDIIKVCNWYKNGTCVYTDDTCWYSHEYDRNVNQTCRFCEQTFESKNQLMVHRKSIHVNIVAKCRNFQLGDCNFSNEECWYKHDEPESQNLVFHKSQQEKPPSEATLKMMNLMEVMMVKMTELEKKIEMKQTQ